MSDDADRAQIEIDTTMAIARLAGNAAPKLRATGRCYNCDEGFTRPEQVFCDPECEQDFAKRRRAEAITGRKSH
jgi:hypothetical protein